MRLCLALALAAASLSPANAAQPDAPTAPQAVLPTVTAYSLGKTRTTLPKDFTAPLNVLILSFQRDQQAEVEGWLPSLKAMASAHPECQFWVLPVFPTENYLYRWWLNASLRNSAPDPGILGHTVPLYVNKPRFLRSLQIGSEKNIALLLTDRSGKVQWTTWGSVSDGKKEALAAALAAGARSK
jgi:hypothetical protein